MDNSLNTLANAMPRLNVLNKNHIEIVYASALDMIERVGFHIPHGKALSLLRNAGCRIENEVAHIPPKLVDRCLKTVPKVINLYTRESELALEVGGDNVYFGAGADSVNIQDPYTGKRRPFILDDVAKGTLIQDALQNIDYVMSMGTPSDVSSESLADVFQFQAMLNNTTKPINFASHSLASTKAIVEMASIVAGGEKILSQKPFIFYFGGGSKPPLGFEPAKLDRVLYLIEKGIPYVGLSVPASGGTAPVTLAGQLVLMLAEMLVILVFSQVVKEGAQIIVGGFPLMMDMKSMIFSYGSPEFLLTNSAITEIFKHLELPIYGSAGCTDAQTLDAQAGIECFASCFIESLSRSNLVHDCGFVESGMTASYDMVVLADEVISMTKRYCDGIGFSPEQLALDVIAQVGHDGTYVGEQHTFEHFRKEQWQPKIISRENHLTWLERGSYKITDRANQKVKSILATYKPTPLDLKVAQKVNEVVERRIKSDTRKL